MEGLPYDLENGDIVTITILTENRDEDQGGVTYPSGREQALTSVSNQLIHVIVIDPRTKLQGNSV